MTKQEMIDKIYEVMADKTLTVMIWDVLDWRENIDKRVQTNKEYTEIREFILWLREHKRKPIGDQSTECIEFIYNLIK